MCGTTLPSGIEGAVITNRNEYPLVVFVKDGDGYMRSIMDGETTEEAIVRAADSDRCFIDPGYARKIISSTRENFPDNVIV